jgi:thiol-disulfide isomerase/thioredoxin
MTLYEFYGDGCPHCEEMEPLVEKLQEQGVEIERLEVWNNEENAKLQQELDDGYCGGVPFFYNTETDQWICGETDFHTLAKWAEGEEV